MARPKRLCWILTRNMAKGRKRESATFAETTAGFEVRAGSRNALARREVGCGRPWRANPRYGERSATHWFHRSATQWTTPRRCSRAWRDTAREQLRFGRMDCGD